MRFIKRFRIERDDRVKSRTLFLVSSDACEKQLREFFRGERARIEGRLDIRNARAGEIKCRGAKRSEVDETGDTERSDYFFRMHRYKSVVEFLAGNPGNSYPTNYEPSARAITGGQFLREES